MNKTWGRRKMFITKDNVIKSIEQLLSTSQPLLKPLLWGDIAL
jgi:hypothetical protein